MRIILITFTFFLSCIISAEMLVSVYVLTSSDMPQIEWSEPIDAEQESKNELTEKTKRCYNSFLDLGSRVSDVMKRTIMTAVDFQTLYHPEITTPPPELG